MRTISFDPSSKRYELAYQSLLFSPLPVQGNERKVHGELLDKLEKIAQLKQMYDGQNQPREYGPDEIRLYASIQGGDVLLTEPEFSLLKRHVTAMADAPTFSKVMSREMDALIEYLETVPKNAEEPAPQPAPAA